GRSSNLEHVDPDTGKSTLDLAAAYLAKRKRNFNDDTSLRIVDDGDWDWIRLVMLHQLGKGLGPSFYPRLQRSYRAHTLADAVHVRGLLGERKAESQGCYEATHRR